MLDRLKTKRRDEIDAHPHNWHLKESRKRTSRARSSGSIVSVPHPQIFRDVAIPYSLRKDVTAPPAFEVYPAPGHVASLLVLIECFDNLRERVEASTTLDEKLDALSLNKDGVNFPVLESTWHKYIYVAVQRFKLWITKIESIVRHSAVFNRYGTGSHLHGAFTENYLPPIDVLLVWFCYLQNPSAYERLLASNEFKLLAQICFPWHIFPTTIDMATMEYKSPSAARALWDNFIAIPYDLEDCTDSHLEGDRVAFTSSDDDLLDLVSRQSNLFRQIQSYRWLRSPALRGTINRALTRYGNELAVGHVSSPEQTQQVPNVQSEESRSLSDFDLDLGMKLILLAHRGYHDAWRMFSQIYSLQDDECPTPPSYDRVMGIAPNSTERIFDIGSGTPTLSQCFCWICERVKDEVEGDENVFSDGVTLLVPVTSPDPMDDKLSTISKSSSSSDGTDQEDLDLSRKQIRQIKHDVLLYRKIEAKRLKAMQGTQKNWS